MARVTGIGGFFLRADDPKALYEWYEKHLGLARLSGSWMFDAEDQRLLESVGRFASAAYQTVQAIKELKSEVAARENAETELRQLTDGLERQVRVTTQ